MTSSRAAKNKVDFERVMRDRDPLRYVLEDYLDDSGITNPNFCSTPIFGTDCSWIVELADDGRLKKCTVMTTYQNYQWFNYILMEIC